MVFAIPEYMDESQILEKVREFADQAHGDQLRRYSSDRYIVHPVRVKETVSDYINDLPVLAASLLHDVLEDTPTTSEQLSEFLKTVMDEDQARRCLQYVLELTDIYTKKNYPRLNRRSRRNKEFERLASASPQAQTIKCADVLDNAIDITDNDPDFALTYLRECKQLLQVLQQGNYLLRHRAMQEVDDRLKRYFKDANITAL